MIESWPHRPPLTLRGPRSRQANGRRRTPGSGSRWRRSALLTHSTGWVNDSVASFATSFPDLQIEIRHLIAEGDLVSTWVTYNGTHKETFAGIPASGASVRFAAWDLMRVKDGRIVELTQYCDLFTLMNQIGARSTAAPMGSALEGVS